MCSKLTNVNFSCVNSLELDAFLAVNLKICSFQCSEYHFHQQESRPGDKIGICFMKMAGFL